jgi:hypothetical protein
MKQFCGNRVAKFSKLSEITHDSRTLTLKVG